VNRCLCLTNQILCHEDILRNGCKDLSIFVLSNNWRWADGFMPWPLYSKGKSILYPIFSGVAGSGACAGEKVLLCWDPDWLLSQSLRQLSYPGSAAAAAAAGIVRLDMISCRIARVNRSVCLVCALIEMIRILHSEVSHSWSFYSAYGGCDDQSKVVRLK
jgi:hypothetical protein